MKPCFVKYLYRKKWSLILVKSQGNNNETILGHGDILLRPFLFFQTTLDDFLVFYKKAFSYSLPNFAMIRTITWQLLWKFLWKICKSFMFIKVVSYTALGCNCISNKVFIILALPFLLIIVTGFTFYFINLAQVELAGRLICDSWLFTRWL